MAVCAHAAGFYLCAEFAEFIQLAITNETDVAQITIRDDVDDAHNNCTYEVKVFINAEGTCIHSQSVEHEDKRKYC